MEVVDAHVHCWTTGSPRTVVEVGAEVPDTLPARELVGAMRDAGVARAMHVTPSWQGFDNSDALAARSEFPGTLWVVGRFDPYAPDLGRRLRELISHDAVKGIRLTLTTREDAARLRSGELDELWTQAERQQVVVALYCPQQAREVARVARDHADLSLVVEHFGVAKRSDSAMQDWHDVFQVARYGRVTLKATLVRELVGPGVSLETAQRYVRHAIEVFGPHRVMWGSDYPIVCDVCSYADALGFACEACSDLSPSEREEIFAGTAMRTWHL